MSQSKPKTPKKKTTKKIKTSEILTLRDCLKLLEEKTAVEVAEMYGKGKNFIPQKLRGIGYESERENVKGAWVTHWNWTNENKVPPFDENMLDQGFVRNNK